LKGGLILEGNNQAKVDFLKDLSVFDNKINKFSKEMKKHEKKKSLCKTSRDKNRWRKKYEELKIKLSEIESERKEFRRRYEEIFPKAKEQEVF
jgi:predicted  nucleic acid-binding Zn-ribbon protein